MHPIKSRSKSNKSRFVKSYRTRGLSGRVHTMKKISKKSQAVSKRIHPTRRLTTVIETLMRQPDEGPSLRNPHGSSSCKLAQFKHLLEPLIKDPHEFMPLIKKVMHKDTSLERYFLYNDATAIPGKPFKKSHFGLFKTTFVLPMAMVRTLDNGISHFFTVIVEDSNLELYMYTAYGSGDVCKYPQKIKLDKKEFGIFLDAINKDVRTKEDDDIIDSFIRKYFLEGGKNPYEKNEADNRRRWPTLYQGIDREASLYRKPYQVYFFDTLEERVLAAATSD